MLFEKEAIPHPNNLLHFLYVCTMRIDEYWR
jgi:hypothetical protein